MLENQELAKQKVAERVALHMVEIMDKCHHFSIVETLRYCGFSEEIILKTLRTLLQKKFHWQGFRETILKNIQKVRLPFEIKCREIIGTAGIDANVMRDFVL